MTTTTTLTNCYNMIMELSDNSQSESKVMNVIFKTKDGKHHIDDDLKNDYILDEPRIIKHMDNFIEKYGIVVEEQCYIQYYMIELEIKLIYATEERRSKFVTHGMPQQFLFH